MTAGVYSYDHAAPPSVRVRGVSRPAAAALGWLAASGVGGGCMCPPQSEADAAEAGAAAAAAAAAAERVNEEAAAAAETETESRKARGSARGGRWRLTRAQ